MTAASPPPRSEPTDPADRTDEGEVLLTSPADIASAGRSCLAIFILGAVILLVLVVWIVNRTLGGE